MDNFYDDFDDGNFMDEDSFEDNIEDNCEAEDSLDDGPEMANEPDEADSCDIGITAQEAFFFGIAMGFAYEEGLEEAERQRLEKEMEDDWDSQEDSKI